MTLDRRASNPIYTYIKINHKSNLLPLAILILLLLFVCLIKLNQVEQRCREYHHQMQIIIASFEQAAGTGSAKSYTQLALKTILKQFRCLKSTISAQIKGLNKSLGEEEDQNEGSRLKFVDQQLRQQRALQQLGMMQPNAWRPQRGLPERAVSVLRAWLFQHFLHP